HFHKALELHPDWANPHIQLITVEMGSGCVEDVIRELKTVLSIDPTNRSALNAGLWAMLPRWGGSHELIKMLAMEAMKCPKRTSGVPAMGYQCLAEIAYDHRGYGWQNVYLAPDVKQCAETLFNEYQSRLKKQDFLAARMWHELAELRYDDAAKTLEELGGEDKFRPHAGWQNNAYWESPIGTPRYDDFGVRIRLFTGKHGEELRNMERDLLAGERDTMLPKIRKLLEAKVFSADEQDFLLDWYARWRLNFSPRSYSMSPKKRTTAFSVAVKNNRTDVAREMLDLGFDWKAHERYPGELANIIATNGNDPSMLDLLKKAGDPLNRQKPDSGYAPIHCASAHGKASMVEALLDAGINVETRCRDGHTPLHTASVMKNFETMKVLLARGANVNAQDNDGDTCLIYLPQLQCPPSTYRFFLEQPGININLANHSGETPMHLMAKWNTSQEIFEMMLSKGAEINARNNRGETPLDIAESSGHPELTQYLRSKGAKSGRELPPMKHPEPKATIGGNFSMDRLLDYAPWFAAAVSVLAIVACAVLVWRKRGKGNN
ncbi:MAG: ankyrin repeat domain-containing protein, partial [Victivallales bacterium]|nr:ankyrin repeat domain-containing protein [Victivallales bacterium]